MTQKHYALVVLCLCWFATGCSAENRNDECDLKQDVSFNGLNRSPYQGGNKTFFDYSGHKAGNIKRRNTRAVQDSRGNWHSMEAG